MIKCKLEKTCTNKKKIIKLAKGTNKGIAAFTCQYCWRNEALPSKRLATDKNMNDHYNRRESV